MVESILFIAARVFKKDFWLFFLTSLGIVILVACRTELRGRFYKLVEEAMKG